MMAAETFLDALAAALDARLRHSPAELAPVALLWPDQARQWGPIIAALRARRLVLELGEYEPAEFRGPAYWIRGVLDGVVEIARADEAGVAPVVYLPGYARSDIRAVEEADERLKPLAELQYRGTIFAQQNGRDWTVGAFLQSKAGGLGIEVADDAATREAIVRARAELGAQPVDDLRRRAPLRASFFDSLLAPDLDRDVLAWLNDPAAFRASRSAEQWEAFRSQFTDRFGMALDEGELAIAGQLGRRSGAWAGVWQRYVEAPGRYPMIEERLRGAAPKRVGESLGLFDGPLGAWPQDNDAAEGRLRRAYLEIASLDAAAAADRIAALEQEHAERRGSVWASLGEAPLAAASAHLATLAAITRTLPAAGSVADLAKAYAEDGWRADDAVMRALAAVTSKADRDAVSGVVRAVYVPWLDEAVRRFQAAVGPTAVDYRVEPLPEWPEGTCVVFIDGLRFDVGRRVEAALKANGYGATLRPRLTALPTITSTAKPAASPVIAYLGPGSGLAPAPRDSGADLGIAALRALLTRNGYQVLVDGESGDPAGRAWTEHGDIDELGHKQEAKLPALLDDEVRSLCERIADLLEAGWRQVAVVTDHGWLYLPGGLPKVELPLYLTKDERMRKGRTGRLADGAVAPGGTVPWYWDPDVRMAVAPGISAFVAGTVYEHGGVSQQECVTPLLTVAAAPAPRGPVTLSIRWRGLRADVGAAGAPPGAAVDLRDKAGAPETSLLAAPVTISVQGTARLLVTDEKALARSAFLVLLDADGHVIAQETVIIGGEG
ncbi:MAG: BREX-1 system phosphatase PglZ type B [Candidatus Limnocylindrales bacterium]